MTLEPIKAKPTASFETLVLFVNDYNNYVISETSDQKEKLETYKQYLQVALKTNKYEMIEMVAFLLKIDKIIIHNDHVIGAIVNVVHGNKIICTELMFFKATTTKAIESQLKKSKEELEALHKRVNAKALLCFPISLLSITSDFSKICITWNMHPLEVLRVPDDKCSRSLTEEYSKGTYMIHIYKLFTKTIFDAWRGERPTELIEFLVSKFKKLNKAPPLSQVKTNEIIDECVSKFHQYDPNVLKITLGKLVEDMNLLDKNVSDCVARINNDSIFVGFDLKNVYRLTKPEMKRKIEQLTKDNTTTMPGMPAFSVDLTHYEQLNNFYSPKTNQLLIHDKLKNDLIKFVVGDLKNPFRREFIINHQIMDELSFKNILPHEGETVYINAIA